MEFVGLILAFGLTIGAFASLIFRFFYPHHRKIALLLYTVSWGFLLYSLWSYRDVVFMHSEVMSDLIVGYAPYLAWMGISFIFLFLLWFLRFQRVSDLASVEAEDFAKTCDDDRDLLHYLDDMLEGYVSRFEDSPFTNDSHEKLNAQQRNLVRVLWKNIFDGIVEVDFIRNHYESFYTFGKSRRKDHCSSFLLFFDCVLLQHYYVHRIYQIVHKNESLEKILNDQDDAIGLPEHTYSLSVGKNTQASEVLQINLGRAYSSILREEIIKHTLYSRTQELLSYIDHHDSTFAIETIKNPLKKFERSTSTTFFPWQKKIACGMSLIRMTERPFLISREFIKKHGDQLDPGDVFVQRREWAATNVGIPGYWTHSALYIGSLDKIDTYFSALSAFSDVLPSEYIAQKYPDVYKDLYSKDDDGSIRCVIEVKSLGVVVSSLEETASCDAIGALRPLLSREQKWRMITQAMEYYGKPYDYNFDFSTDNALVCSELIYKALEGIPHVSFEAEMINGRLLFTPNQFVEKFDEEYEEDGRIFDFVFFWDGDEKDGAIYEREVQDLRKSWKRPKWHILSQYFEE